MAGLVINIKTTKAGKIEERWSLVFGLLRRAGGASVCLSPSSRQNQIYYPHWIQKWQHVRLFAIVRQSTNSYINPVQPAAILNLNFDSSPSSLTTQEGVLIVGGAISDIQPSQHYRRRSSVVPYQHLNHDEDCHHRCPTGLCLGLCPGCPHWQGAII